MLPLQVKRSTFGSPPNDRVISLSLCEVLSLCLSKCYLQGFALWNFVPIFCFICSISTKSMKFYHDISTGNFVSGEFCFALASLVVTILYAFIGRKSFFYSSRCVSCQCPCELCSCISFRRHFPISKFFHSSISLSPRCITITSVQNVFMLRSCWEEWWRQC